MAQDIPDPREYHVDPFIGFVLPTPLQLLPCYYKQWSDIASELETLIKSELVRIKVDELPVLDTLHLTSHKEFRLAHLVLCLITSGYMWEKGEDNLPGKIPESLAVPLCEVSERVGLPPIVNHASCALANYKLIDKSGKLEIDNLRLIYYPCGGFDIEWFFLVALQIELDFAQGSLNAILNAQRSVLREDKKELLKCLNTINVTINKMKNTLSRIHEHCQPGIFYKVFRPFLAGWKDGVIYEGCYGSEKQSYCGGSAAQSSAVQCIDAVLGVQHAGGEGKFLMNMRDYMPNPHKKFIEALEHGPSVKTYVMQSGDDELNEAYVTCLASLTMFRSYHIQIVTKYITIQAGREDENVENVRKYTGLAKVGTGGTGILPFLQTVRDETKMKIMK